MNSLIGQFQNAFVLRRSINDNCVIAHEMLYKVKKSKKNAKYSMILNLDLNKAYDRIRWDFVREVLNEVGFPARWTNIIMECISSVTYSVLVNGEPTRSFTPSAGLR